MPDVTLVPEGRRFGLRKVKASNGNCEHSVRLWKSERGKVDFAVRFAAEECPYCLHREVKYLRGRLKATEGEVRSALRILAALRNATVLVSQGEGNGVAADVGLHERIAGFLRGHRSTAKLLDQAAPK